MKIDLRTLGERDAKAGKSIDAFQDIPGIRYKESQRAEYEIGYRAAKSKKNQMVFDVEWSGEMAAGIRPGSEVVTVSLKYGPVDDEAIEYFSGVIADYFDGATVTPR